MSSTYTCLHYHFIFSTKNRQPWIRPEIRIAAHKYLSGTIHGLGATVEAIGGVEDHVHLLVRLPPTNTPAAFMREVKKASSLWMKAHAPDFAWQDGYAVFSTSLSHLNDVQRYIEQQEEHHRKRTFLEELQIFLEKHGIEYDPAYLT